jgi:hypothetical protein
MLKSAGWPDQTDGPMTQERATARGRPGYGAARKTRHGPSLGQGDPIYGATDSARDRPAIHTAAM